MSHVQADTVVMGKVIEKDLEEEMKELANLGPVERAFKLGKAGRWSEARAILDAEPKLWQSEESEGYTFLHWGALAGEPEIVARALAMGVPVDALPANRQTPLMWAIIRGQIEIMKMLLEAGANLYAQDSFGATTLILAVQHRQHAALLLLIAAADKEQLLSLTDENGCGPVHWGAYKGDVTSLSLLSYFDADFNKLDQSRMTPLHRAVQASQNSIIELLLDKGVNPAQLDREGRNIVDMANQNQDNILSKVLDRLLEVPKGDANSEMGGLRDLEEGKPLQRKKEKEDLQKLEDLKKRVMMNGAATFWLVCVSLTIFQYLTDLRQVVWEAAPTAAMAFELGVPLSLALFFLTALSDPGKVRSRVKGNSGVEELMKALLQSSPSQAADVAVDVGRLCTTTWIVKDLRAKYCKMTGAVVEDFDHFCGWLNAAIGKGNHRQFIFLAIVEVMTQLCHLYLCWAAAGVLVPDSKTSTEFVLRVSSEYPLLTMMAFAQLLSAPGILMLNIHQWRLIVMNMTTNEMMNAYRYQHFWQTGSHGQRKFRNPFHKGNILWNCLDFWWIRRRSDFGPGAHRRPTAA